MLSHEFIVKALDLVALAANLIAAGFHFLNFLLQHGAVILCLPMQQAYFQHVVDPRQHLGQLKRLADEIFCAGLECVQLVPRLGGDDQHRKVAVRFN